MARRHGEFRKARLSIESLELRIAPTIVAVNGGGNTPRESPPAEVVALEPAQDGQSAPNVNHVKAFPGL